MAPSATIGNTRFCYSAELGRQLGQAADRASQPVRISTRRHTPAFGCNGLSRRVLPVWGGESAGGRHLPGSAPVGGRGHLRAEWGEPLGPNADSPPRTTDESVEVERS